MLSATAVGFTVDEVSQFPHIAWALHDPSSADDMTEREYMLMAKQMVNQSDVLVCNLNRDGLTPDEVVLIHSAYTNSTPILAVGYKILTPLLKEMVSHRFADLEYLVDHLMANYKISK